MLEVGKCRTMVLVIKEPIEGPNLRKEKVKCINDEIITGAGERKLVCVTSGCWYFGSQLVKKLLEQGYLVRATIQYEVDLDDMKELITEEEMMRLESVVVANMADVETLCCAFSGCHAVFHTSSFVDPHGVSGYSEQMAIVETEGASNVIEACGRAASVRRCIFTSSFLATIWSDNEENRVIDENCWSSEEFCRENGLWAALAKTKAEKAVWMKSKEFKVKLVSICSALLMAPSFPNAHIETCIPYLKGGDVMLRRGVLAIVDVNEAVEAHVRVYKAMDDGACGRYICFGKIIKTLDEAAQLEDNLKIYGRLTGHTNTDLFNQGPNTILCGISASKLDKLFFCTSHSLSCKQL